MHWAIMSFFFIPLSQSLAFMGSLAWEKEVGEFVGTQPNEIGVVVEVGVLATSEPAS
jgi:hypothetical protein